MKRFMEFGVIAVVFALLGAAAYALYGKPYSCCMECCKCDDEDDGPEFEEDDDD